MKKIVLLFFVLIIVVSGGIYGFQHQEELATQFNDFLYQSPCTTISYRLGNIDPRFNLSQQELLVDTKQAAALWNNAYGKPLLVYDPQAQMPINLVYDERQALSTQIDQVDQSLAQKEDALKPEIAAYEQKAADFKKRINALNQEIENWNTKGGAPSDVYDRLTASQKELQGEGSQLQAQAQSLNQSTDQYNTQVRDLSQKVNTFNTAIKEKPEEGLFISDEKGKRIYIYFNTSQSKLVHTLAHEMGHAIGLNHVAETTSIMYPKTNEIIEPSSGDLNELASVCRKQSVSERFTNRINYIMDMIKQGRASEILQNIKNNLH